MPDVSTKETRAPSESLQLVRGGQLVRSEDISPVGVFIASLNSEESKRSMRVCLRRAASIMSDGAFSTSDVEWQCLRFAHLEMLKERMQRRKFQPSTINTTLCALRGVARAAWMLRLPEMSGEDYQRIQAVRGVRGKRDRSGRALSVRELEKLFQTCAADPSIAGARDACLIALMAGGGLRRNEVVLLDLSSYQLSSHKLKVTGKGDRERTITFEDGATRKYVSVWIRLRGVDAGPLLYPVDKAGRIAPRRMSAEAVFKILRKRARQAGIRRVSPHDFRRTFATELLDRGADMSAVQQLMGHASIETTVIYDHRKERGAQKAMRAVSLPWARRRKVHSRRRRHGKKRHFKL